MRLILGSKSKGRRELMKLLNMPYEVIVSDCEEIYDKTKTPYEQSVSISYAKALKVFEMTEGDRLVIGADTIVLFNDKIYGKPKSLDDAFNMLKSLQGNSHEIITGLTVMVFKNGQIKEETTYVKTDVYLDKISDKEINHWIHSHDVLQMAGSYNIEEEFACYVEKINGDYSNIIGLPLNKLKRIINKYMSD